MKHVEVRVKPGFNVLAETKQSQAATMAIKPGDSEGGPENKHHADQWLYVMSGEGEAVVEGQTVELFEGTLLLIAAGETHEIKNNSEETLRTLNIYAPPEF